MKAVIANQSKVCTARRAALATLAQVGDGADNGGEHQRDHRNGEQLDVTRTDGLHGADQPVDVAVGCIRHCPGDETDDDTEYETGDDLRSECRRPGRKTGRGLFRHAGGGGAGMTMPFENQGRRNAARHQRPGRFEEMFPGTRQVRASAYTLRSPAGEGRRNADWSGTTLSTHYAQLQRSIPQGPLREFAS